MVNKKDFNILLGNSVDVLRTIEDGSVQCCVTSPPYYGLRDYGTGKWVGGDPNCPHRRTNKVSVNTCTGHKKISEEGQSVGDAIYKNVCQKCGAVREDKQIGLEETPEEYINRLVEVFREVRRVLKDDGTLWVNIGDSYATNCSSSTKTQGNDEFNKNRPSREQTCLPERHVPNGIKQKDLIGIPWMLAFALRADGWYLRQDIIWHKPNPMPESVKDRCTKSHEYLFLLSKSPKYKFNYDSIQEIATGYDGRNDTMMHGSVKYAGQSICPNQSVQSMASNGHERWKFVSVDSGIKFGGNKCGDSDDPLYSIYSGETWKARGIETESGVVPIRNKRDVWSISVNSYKGAHFATYPMELVEPCILAGSDEGSVILDPFNGSGTTGIVAVKNNRKYVGIDLNKEYTDLSNERFDEYFFSKKAPTVADSDSDMKKYSFIGED